MKFKLFVNWKKSLVIFVIGLIISLIYLCTNGFNSAISYCNAFFISGFIIIAISILSTLSYFGAFDTISYSFYSLGRVFTKEKEMGEKKYKDLVDYVEKKKATRKKFLYSFLPYVYSGLIFMLASIILFFFV